MRTSSEKTLERKGGDIVKRYGGLYIKLFSPSFTGLPDRFILLPGGKVLFVEWKSRNGVLSPRQKIVIPQLQKLGFKVLIINSEEQLKDLEHEIRTA